MLMAVFFYRVLVWVRPRIRSCRWWWSRDVFVGDVLLVLYDGAVCASCFLCVYVFESQLWRRKARRESSSLEGRWVVT